MKDYAKSAVLLKTARRKRSQTYEERKYVNNDAICEGAKQIKMSAEQCCDTAIGADVRL